MNAAATRRAATGALAITVALAVSACQDDGRDLRDPSAPLPPVTTTSTTLPPDVVAPGTVAP
jgi:hypothetical protein